eukprot:scaffold127408_cov17-Tisochrysis_lutea.AAC.1
MSVHLEKDASEATSKHMGRNLYGCLYIPLMAPPPTKDQKGALLTIVATLLAPFDLPIHGLLLSSLIAIAFIAQCSASSAFSSCIIYGLAHFNPGRSGASNAEELGLARLSAGSSNFG